jgi:hypothetical protein
MNERMPILHPVFDHGEAEGAAAGAAADAFGAVAVEFGKAVSGFFLDKSRENS